MDSTTAVIDALERAPSVIVPLVREMRHRPTVQTLIPVLSMQTVRLFRPGATSASQLGDEFAWIEAVIEGRFRLSLVQHRGVLN